MLTLPFVSSMPISRALASSSEAGLSCGAPPDDDGGGDGGGGDGGVLMYIGWTEPGSGGKFLSYVFIGCPIGVVCL